LAMIKIFYSLLVGILPVHGIANSHRQPVLPPAVRLMSATTP
jgi:hypothetical protein